MIVVLDCNILVMCLNSRSPYHIIYEALTNEKFDIAVTTEILLEYEEIVQQKFGNKTANALMALLQELPNVHHITAFYKWLLIDNDPDDNKYIDCFIAGKAEHLVSQDQHFNVVKTISFPKIEVLSIDAFADILKSLP